MGRIPALKIGLGVVCVCLIACATQPSSPKIASQSMGFTPEQVMVADITKLDKPAPKPAPFSRDRLAALWTILEKGQPSEPATLRPVYLIELDSGSSFASQRLLIYVQQDGYARMVRGDDHRSYSFRDDALFSFAAETYKSALQRGNRR